MQRSAIWPTWVWFLLTVAAPAFGVVASSSSAETSDVPAETPAVVVTTPGLEAVAAIAGASSSGAVTSVIVDQRVVGNRVEERNISRATLFENSGRDNIGIVNINQDAGNVNDQANVTAVAILPGGAPAGSAGHGFDVTAAATRTDNTVITDGGHRENRIIHSFGGTVGLVGAHQSVGSLNSQANLVAVNLGVLTVPGFAVLGDPALGEVAPRNNVLQERAGGSRIDVITDSFMGYRGVALVSQVSGDLNVVRNVATISVMVISDALTLTPPAGVGR